MLEAAAVNGAVPSPTSMLMIAAKPTVYTHGDNIPYILQRIRDWVHFAMVTIVPGDRNHCDAMPTQAGDEKQLHVEGCNAWHPDHIGITVQAVPRKDVVDRFPAEELEPALTVFNTREQHEPDKRVEYTAHDVAVARLTHALGTDPLARTDRYARPIFQGGSTRFPRLQGSGQINVHEANDVAPRGLHACKDSRRLAPVWFRKYPDLRTGCGQGPGNNYRVVGTSVVHDDDFCGVSNALEVTPYRIDRYGDS